MDFLLPLDSDSAALRTSLAAAGSASSSILGFSSIISSETGRKSKLGCQQPAILAPAPGQTVRDKMIFSGEMETGLRV